jgi:hypothetical protein
MPVLLKKDEKPQRGAWLSSVLWFYLSISNNQNLVRKFNIAVWPITSLIA